MNCKEKSRYICGSSNPERFKQMQKIIMHYAHEHPEFHKKEWGDGKIYQSISVYLTPEEEKTIRQEISWIGVPESERRLI